MKNASAMLAIVGDKKEPGTFKIFDIMRFSSLSKLLRSACWVLRFIVSLKGKRGPRENHSKYLRSEEIINAKKIVDRRNPRRNRK